MQEAFGSHYCSLHVRYTNTAAFHLYSQTLGYKIEIVEKGYYADGEDAYSMKCEFKQPSADKAKGSKVKKAPLTAEIPAIPPTPPIAEDVIETAADGVKAIEGGFASVDLSGSNNS